MYKEKHILNHQTAGHKLSRYLDVYELNTVNCSADKTTGYKGDTITITGTPAWNQKTSSYSVTGATLTGNQFDFTGSDVTAQANYETAKSITTQNCSANKVSGFSGDNVTVTGTPAWNQKLSGYSITGATLTGNNFKIANSNVTVQGKYETAKNVTLQATDGGSIGASRLSGFIGDSVTLSNTANAGYEFSAYTLTGANLTGSTFNLTGSDVTAKAWYLLTATPTPDKFLRDTNGNDIYNRNDMLDRWTLSIDVHADDKYMYDVECFDPISAHYNYLMVDYDMSNTVSIPSETEVFNGLSAGISLQVYTTAQQYTMSQIGFYDHSNFRDHLYENSAMFLNNSPVFGGYMFRHDYTATNTAAFVSADHLMYKELPTTTKHYHYIHDIRYGGVSAWVNGVYVGKMAQTPIYVLHYINKRGGKATTVSHVTMAVFSAFTAASAWQR